MADTATIRSAGTRLRDTRVFFRAWIRDPLRVGAVAPSGRGLAGLITSEITLASAPILELGPGTGVFTRALLARGSAGAERRRRLAHRPTGREVWGSELLGPASATVPGIRSSQNRNSAGLSRSAPTKVYQ